MGFELRSFMKKLIVFLFTFLLTQAVLADEVTIYCSVQPKSYSREDLELLKKDANSINVKTSQIFSEDNLFYLNLTDKKIVARKKDESNDSFWQRQEEVKMELKTKIEKRDEKETKTYLKRKKHREII